VDRLLTICYLPVCLIFLLLTMKLSSWTRLRILASYAGFSLSIMLIPVVCFRLVGWLGGWVGWVGGEFCRGTGDARCAGF